MCEPLTVAAIATTALSVGACVYSANQQQKALNNQAAAQQVQIDQAASAQTDDRLKVAREQRAAARAASAQSGTSGNSTDAILTDLLMQSGRDVSCIEKNRENGQLESQQEARSKSAEINGQLIGSLGNAAESGIKIAPTAYDVYKNYIPKIPNAGQHTNPLPKASLALSKYTIGT